MRTTLTLDPDVQRLIEDEMHRRRAGMKTVVNDAIRAALTKLPPLPPYQVKVHHTALLPGIDASRLNELVDELADDDSYGARRAARGSQVGLRPEANDR